MGSNALNGIKNFLQLINDNWALLVAIFGLAYGIYKKIAVFFHKTREEQIAIAKEQIRESILKMISDAEVDYADFVKAGEIKRSQVIQEIYQKYPILAHVENQDELVQWIDENIDNALKTLRKIVKENKVLQ